MSAMKPYIVRQGEYLTKIAFEQGFDADEVWGHEKNRDLKDRRKDPSVLCPGDVLAIPDSAPIGEGLSLCSDNPYRAKVPNVELNVQFCGDDAGPLAAETCSVTVEGDGKSSKRSTDADGWLRLIVPGTCKSVEVTFERLGTTYVLAVGHLDPIDTTSGEFQRMSNLGKFDDALIGWLGSSLGGPSGEVEELQSMFREAVRRNLASPGEDDGGVTDEAVRDHLAREHKR